MISIFFLQINGNIRCYQIGITIILKFQQNNDNLLFLNNLLAVKRLLRKSNHSPIESRRHKNPHPQYSNRKQSSRAEDGKETRAKGRVLKRGERVKTAVSPERNNKRASRVKAIIPWVLFDFQGSSVRSIPRTTNRAAGPFAYVYVCSV